MVLVSQIVALQYFSILILTIYQQYDNGIYFDDTGILIIPLYCPALDHSQPSVILLTVTRTSNANLNMHMLIYMGGT